MNFPIIPISGGLKPGATLTIQGVLPAEVDMFAINLLCGESEDSDVALRFNPRFDAGNKVFFNSCQDGAWGAEETTSMPFSKGGAFEMVIVVKSEGYMVKVNGQKIYTFQHRIPLDRVSALQATGQISIMSINITGGMSGHSFSDTIAPILGGLNVGTTVNIQGVLPAEVEMFAINLLCGESEDSDIALRFNPRFDAGNKVFFNSCQDGAWGAEETTSMPFSKGGAFEMVIVVKSEGYMVKVNGQKIYTFQHRIPLDRVSALQATGQISNMSINITGGMSGHSFSHPIAPIPGGLHVGTTVNIQGVLPAEVDMFAINLLCGESEDSDVALRFNPRFDAGNKVFFNSCQDGAWGAEETTSMPFSKGGFEMVIVVKSEGYMVKVNGQKIYTFQHRIPLDRVSALQATGQISNMSINITGGMQISNSSSTQWNHGIFQSKMAGSLMMSGYPINNPSLPYVGSINGGLKTGMAIYFQGVVPVDAKNFRIDLKCGESEGSDIALHFNPRFMANKIVLNSCEKGGWKNEESVNLPFSKGESFEMIFIITSEGYQVNVNGQQVYLFQHRIPLDMVCALQIKGDVSIQTINVFTSWSGYVVSDKQGMGISSSSSIQWNLGVFQSEMAGSLMMSGYPINNPSLPYVGSINGGLKTGMAIYFQGVVPVDAKNFRIDLKCGESEGSDIALHFNPRFMANKIVLNSCEKGGWKNEESVNLPFSKGESFEMIFIITSEGYQVNVNGQQVYLFQHRIPLDMVCALQIKGDVSIQTINVFTSLPYVGSINGGLKTGMAIYFQGVVPMDANSFGINLKCGESEGSDIALHFNPRFTANKIVLNSCEKGGWKKEEYANLPFSKGENFEVVFIITSEGYQVNVNGQEVYLFQHRIPLDMVCALQVKGDVSIQTINVFTVSESSS